MTRSFLLIAVGRGVRSTAISSARELRHEQETHDLASQFVARQRCRSRRRRCLAGASRHRIRASACRRDAAALQGVDLARPRAGTHDVARCRAAADQRPPGRGAHRSHESLLHARPGRSRLGAAAAAERAAGARAGRARAAAEHAAHQRHGRHPGSWRRRHRRSRRSRGAARASRRPRLRVRHAALRRVLSLPARPLGHVPVLERDRCRRSRRRSPISQTARPSIENSHIGGLAEVMVHVRGVGRADLHDEAGCRGRHGLRLHERGRARRDRRRTR